MREGTDLVYTTIYSFFYMVSMYTAVSHLSFGLLSLLLMCIPQVYPVSSSALQQQQKLHVQS
jgi:drug/metabolite transporter (DMT)-like permease